jgi:hypothetical protein
MSSTNHWWNQQWVPVLIIIYSAYAVLASVLVAWFLWQRRRQKQVRAPPAIRSSLTHIATAAAAAAAITRSPCYRATRVEHRSAHSSSRLDAGAFPQRAPSASTTSTPWSAAQATAPALKDAGALTLPSYEAALLRSNEAFLRPAPLAMVGAYPVSVALVSSAPTTPAGGVGGSSGMFAALGEQSVVERAFARRYRAWGIRRLQQRSVREMKRSDSREPLVETGKCYVFLV